MGWHPDMPTEYRDQIITGDARLLGLRVPSESVDLVLTDPPFGIGFTYSNGYKDDPKAYPDLLRWTIAESMRVVRPGGLCFVFVAQPQLRDVLPLFPDDSRIFAACKNFVQIRGIPVEYAYDPVLFWRKPGEPLRASTGRDWHIGNTANTNRQGYQRAKFHSCPRPLNTMVYMAENFAPAGGTVLDWFMGSGTTAVAAKLTGRHWVGFELHDETAAAANARVILTPMPLPGIAVEQIVMEVPS